MDGQTGAPLGWTAWAAESTCAYTLATAHSGVACALLTDADGKVSQGLRCRPVEVTPGRTYEAGVWVQIARATAGFALYLEYWCGTQRIKDVSVSCAPAPGWQRLAVKAEAPPTVTSATVIVYSSSANSGSAYFDDVSLALLP